MDRLTRKELKTDKFALEVGHTVDYISDHKKTIARYGTLALAVIIVILAIWGFMRYRAGVRQDDLRTALRTMEATVGGQPNEGMLSFATQAEKDKAVEKALSEVASKYPGTEQGGIAEYYLGSQSADHGDLAGAEKHLRTVIDSGDKNYVSLARLALAPVLQAENKTAEGEKLLREAIANPTMFVSKEQATIALAHYLAPSNPAEARKLLEPLRAERSAVSRSALTALSEIPQK